MRTIQQLEALSLADLVSMAVSERLIEGAERRGLVFVLHIEGIEFPLSEAGARIFLQRLLVRQGGGGQPG